MDCDYRVCNTFTTNKRPITFKELSARWDGVPRSRILRLIYDGEMNACIQQKISLNKKTEQAEYQLAIILLNFRNQKSLLEKCVFHSTDIERIELKYPHYLEEDTTVQLEIKELESELEASQKEVAALKEKLAHPHPQEPDEALEDFFASYPIIQRIFELHQAGKDRAEIVTELTQKDARLASNLLAGWFSKDELDYQSCGAIKQEVKRLKKKKMA